MAKNLKPIELIRQQLREFKKAGGVLPPAYGLEQCYVCGRKEHARSLKFIGKGPDGESIYRHDHCEAGSISWFRNMPNSRWRKYFPPPDAIDNGNK